MKMEEIADHFGDVKPVSVDGVTGEFAFVTQVMSEAEFEKAAETTEGIITRIRME